MHSSLSLALPLSLSLNFLSPNSQNNKMTFVVMLNSRNYDGDYNNNNIYYY